MGGGGGGGYSTKFYAGRLHLCGKVTCQFPTPYPFVYHLDRKGTPFVYLSLKTDPYPFHLPTEEHLHFFSKPFK